VGNTGSRHKFKYGPLGHTVNLASRVQGATRYLGCPLLITGTTQALLPSGFDARRLCRVQVVNIAESVDLYELPVQGEAGWSDLKQAYEEALRRFEAREFRPAAGVLGRLLHEHPDDGPSLVLMSRAVNCLVDEVPEHHPVWDLPGK
jgi:adenylate cyclase